MPTEADAVPTHAATVPEFRCRGCGAVIGWCPRPDRLQLPGAIIEDRVRITCAACWAKLLWRPSSPGPVKT